MSKIQTIATVAKKAIKSAYNRQDEKMAKINKEMVRLHKANR